MWCARWCPTPSSATPAAASPSPGSRELFAGDPLEITARLVAGPQQPLELVLHLADGTTTVAPMTPRDGGAIYQLGRAERSFDYEVRAGRQTSDRYKITVWPEPLLKEPRVTLEFPAYTGWAAREQVLGEGVAAINGTKIELRSKLNTPVVAARLEIDGQAAGVTELGQAADGGSLSARWTLEKPGPGAGRVMLKHRLGREFAAARFAIETRPDAAPEVKWLDAPAKEQRLRADDLLEEEYQIGDDVGLGAVQLEVQPEQGEAARLPVDGPPPVARSAAPLWHGRIHQALGVLVSRWPKSPVFKLRVRAEDSRSAAFGGPGVGVSEWISIRIDNNAPSLARQNVAAAQQDARETIEQARQLVQQAPPGFAGEPSGQPGDFDAQFAQPVAEIAVMLLRQQLGGRHQRRLGTGFHRPQRGGGGDDRFTGADIALQQPQHRPGPSQISPNFLQNPPLGAGEGEGQAFQKALAQSAMTGQRWRGLALNPRPQPAQAELVGQQFFKRQPPPGRMVAALQLRQRYVRRRPMQQRHRLGDGRQLQLRQQSRWQQFRERRRFQLRQRLVSQAAQGKLLQTGGGGIDRGQPVVHRRRIRTEPAAFRVDHLQAGVALPDFAEAAQPRARLAQYLLLGRAEMEEAQGQDAGTIGHMTEQEAPAARRHLAADHLGLDLRFLTGLQAVDRADTGTVLIAQRQVQQHVPDGGDAQPAQPFGQLGSDALERGHRQRFGSRLRYPGTG